ncbi:hypothetical protein RND81_05G175800 [Saponaria officinalis]|uniref:Cytochrome P450 n=1 Tax=Saponaria officinalis TaxID=3572 RepID=A0AAW1L0D2_SAPOF
MLFPPTLLTISIVVIVIIVTHYYFRRFKFNLPPGPRPWPVVGNIFNLKPIQFRCFNEWSQIYGPIISVWFGSTLNIVVSNSRLAKEVLKTHDYELANRQRTMSQANFTKNGMDLTWANYGPHYVKVRKICALELFTNKKIEALRFIREDEVSSMVNSIHKKCIMNTVTLTIRKHLMDVALNHITRITFGKKFINSKEEIDLQGQKFMNIVLNVRKIKRPPMVVEYVPWLRWISWFYDKPLNMHKKCMDCFAKEIMREDNKSHFVDALVSCKDEYQLSEDTIIGLLWDMIMAGMDTIGITVEWAMAELLRHPQVLQKAQQELDQVIGQERIMNEDDLINLPYLQAIIKETLRMHPPTPLMLPHCANSNIKIGGYDVPKDTIVHVNVWAIGRDPDIWTDPHEFRPERFFEEDVDIKGHDFRLLPFGSGRRVCLGTQLGLNLVTLILGRLLHHFNWSLPSGVRVKEISMCEIPGTISYMATPLQVVPHSRLPSHLYNYVVLDDI